MRKFCGNTYKWNPKICFLNLPTTHSHSTFNFTFFLQTLDQNMDILYQTLSTLWHFVTLQVTNWNAMKNLICYLCEDFYFIFRCYSYDYGDTGLHVCRLSHQTTSTLYLIDEPYIRSEAAVTYQRGACYNVTIECQVYISMKS